MSDFFEIFSPSFFSQIIFRKFFSSVSFPNFSTTSISSTLMLNKTADLLVPSAVLCTDIQTGTQPQLAGWVDIQLGGWATFYFLLQIITDISLCILTPVSVISGSVSNKDFLSNLHNIS